MLKQKCEDLQSTLTKSEAEAKKVQEESKVQITLYA